jgi:hypothetical protein
MIGFKDYYRYVFICCLGHNKKYKKQKELYLSGSQQLNDELDIGRVLKILRMAEAFIMLKFNPEQQALLPLMASKFLNYKIA